MFLFCGIKMLFNEENTAEIIYLKYPWYDME
jgi:hypothetical protein